MKPLTKLLIPAVFIFNALVGQAQSIELELSSANQEVEIGQTAMVTIKAKVTNGFNGQIFLKLGESNMPNSKYEFSTDLISPPYTEISSLSITPFAGTEERDYILTIDAFNGGLKISKKLIIVVKKSKCAWEVTNLSVSFVDAKGEYWGGEIPNIFKISSPNTKYSLPIYEYRNRYIDANNNFWFATNKGIVKFDGNVVSVLNASNSGLPITDIYFAIVDQDNAIWISDNKKLYKRTNEKWELMDLGLTDKEVINDIKIDGMNNIWVVANNYTAVSGNNTNTYNNSSMLQKISKNGITKYDQTNSCLPKSKLSKINVDKNNIIWIGVYNESMWYPPFKQNSILKFDGNTWEFWCNKEATPYNHYLMDTACNVILQDNNSGYEGTYGNEISIDANNTKWLRTVGPGGTNLGLSKLKCQRVEKF